MTHTATLFTCLLLALTLGGTQGSWVNNLDGPANFVCEKGQFLSHINSEHHNHEEDRVWNFGCSPLPVDGAVSNCITTNYVNDYDQPFTYQCPGEGFITGMDSVHNNHYEDRRFQFHCCEIPDVIVHACYFTDWQNDFDHLLNYYVPSGKVLRGMSSYHEDHYEDRRFKFEICTMGLDK